MHIPEKLFKCSIIFILFFILLKLKTFSAGQGQNKLEPSVNMGMAVRENLFFAYVKY